MEADFQLAKCMLHNNYKNYFIISEAFREVWSSSHNDLGSNNRELDLREENSRTQEQEV